MADPKSPEQNKAEDDADAAAVAAAAEKAKADAAREEQRLAEKAKADNQHLHDADYSGPLTGDQAAARLAKFGPLSGRETKPATVPSSKAGK